MCLGVGLSFIEKDCYNKFNLVDMMFVWCVCVCFLVVVLLLRPYSVIVCLLDMGLLCLNRGFCFEIHVIRDSLDILLV